MMPERYIHMHGIEPSEQCAVWVYTTVPVCHFIKGRKWDELALSAVLAMRPDKVRVIEHGALASDDGHRYRITVRLNKDGNIASVVQEVPVPCPEVVKHAAHWKELVGIAL